VQLKNSGAPVDWFAIPPVIARVEGIAVARRAAHPNAAILFYDFMLTDAQDLLGARNYLLVRRKTESPIEGISVTFLDPAKDLDNSQKWSKNFRDTIINRAR
jgi:iron(III) transport system substrate-binding protein